MHANLKSIEHEDEQHAEFLPIFASLGKCLALKVVGQTQSLKGMHGLLKDSHRPVLTFSPYQLM